MYFLPCPAPPIVIPTTTPSAIIHKLSGTSATLGFAIDGASPVVQISDIVWSLEKDDGSVQTFATNGMGRHNFSSDLLSLTIDPLEEADEGKYTLTASNGAGSGHSSIYLNIGSECSLHGSTLLSTSGMGFFQMGGRTPWNSNIPQKSMF